MGRQRTRMEVWLGCGVATLAVVVVALTITIIVMVTKKSDALPAAPTAPASTVSTVASTTLTIAPPPADPYQQPYNENLYDTIVRQNLAQQADISTQLLQEFQPMNIRDNLRWLTKTLHVAGTPENAAVMKQLGQQYQSYGLTLKTHDYQVLLSYPNYSMPNTIEVQLAGQMDWNLVSNGTAQLLGPPEAMQQENDSRALNWWNGYAKDGVATGRLVYANYGSLTDYVLLDSHNISLQGAIVIARYGDIFRGAIAVEAERRGAVGVIIFNDPLDYANDLPASDTFPNTIWLPPSGAQRGTLLQTDGDPLTPFYPAKPYTYRTTDEATLRKEHAMPNVPVTPIGYRDALTIFQQMTGPEVTGDFAQWKGGMNVTYRMNGGDSTFRLTVNAFTDMRTITNVVALFYGADEPDKWVMFGNHVDAWTFGSIDPNSGTATMLEMARVVATVSNRTGWRPKRTLAFCQWDAEEYGLVGSTEYVEEHLKLLENRAIALLNVDNINGNVTLAAKGVPLLYRALVDAAAKVPTPNPNEAQNGRATLLDSWKLYNARGPLPGDKSVPGIGLPGSGSDFQRFIAYVGVPVLDLKIVCAPIDCYTLYHSMYEVSWMVENMLDQNFHTYTAMGQLWLELGRNLADSLIIPFNVHDYGTMMGVYVNNLDNALRKIGIDKAISDYAVAMSNLTDSVTRFQAASTVIQGYIDAANGGDSITLRQVQMLNNRLTQVERAFINEFGLYPERAISRHVVYAKSIHDDYAGVTFSGILDPAADWLTSTTTNTTMAAYWATTARYGISKLQYAIESAILVISVLFALKVLVNHYFPHSDTRLFGWLPVPSRYACWAELLLIQIISPNASFIGHLAGILVGLAYTLGPLRYWMDILSSALQINDGGERTHNDRRRPPPSSTTSGNQQSFWGSGTWGGGSSGDQHRPKTNTNTHTDTNADTNTRRRNAPRDYGWDSSVTHDYTAGLSEEEQMRQAMEDSLRSEHRYQARSYRPPYPSAPPLYPDIND